MLQRQCSQDATTVDTTAAQLNEKVATEMAYKKVKTLKTQCRQTRCYSIGYISLPISCLSNNVSILHHFRAIITLTAYMTARDLQKSFVSIPQLKL